MSRGTRTSTASIDDQSFILEFTFNGKRYSVFEEEKTFSHTPDDETEPHTFTLRHLIIWNHSSHRRTCGLAYGGQSTEEAVCAILSRWGASENTFKHIQERHPLHYHPGFALAESERQEIANPEIKENKKLITRLRQGIAKLHQKPWLGAQYCNASHRSVGTAATSQAPCRSGTALPQTYSIRCPNTYG